MTHISSFIFKGWSNLYQLVSLQDNFYFYRHDNKIRNVLVVSIMEYVNITGRLYHSYKNQLTGRFHSWISMYNLSEMHERFQVSGDEYPLNFKRSDSR